MTNNHRIVRPAVIGLVALMVVCATFAFVLATSDSEATFAQWNKGDKFALKGERNLGLDLDLTYGMLKFGDGDSYIRNATLSGASVSGYTGTVALFEVTDVTADEYVLTVTVVSNLTLAAKLSMNCDLVQPGSYIDSWSYMFSTNPDNLLNLSQAPTFEGTYGFDTQLAAASNSTYTVHMEKSTMALKSIAVEMTSYAKGYFNMDNYANTTDYWDGDNYIDLMNITSYDSFKSNISMDLSMSGSLDFEPYITMLKDGPEQNDLWEQTSFMNGTFNWKGVVDMTNLPANITDAMFNEKMAEYGITGFPIDLAKIYNPDSSGMAINNGTLEIEAQEVNPEFSCLGFKTVDDPVYGSIEVTRYGFRNASQENYLELWYYPQKGYLVGIEGHTPPTYNDMVITYDMKSVGVADAQEDVDAIIDQVSHGMTYDQLTQTVTPDSGSSGISQMLLVALGAVAVAVVGVIAFVLLRKKQ